MMNDGLERAARALCLDARVENGLATCEDCLRINRFLRQEPVCKMPRTWASWVECAKAAIRAYLEGAPVVKVDTGGIVMCEACDFSFASDVRGVHGCNLEDCPGPGTYRLVKELDA